MSLPARRFPPPWSVEETDACFIVRDANGQALTYVYFEEVPGRRAAAKLLTRDGARRIAANIARRPELPRRKDNRPVERQMNPPQAFKREVIFWDRGVTLDGYLDGYFS